MVSLIQTQKSAHKKWLKEEGGIENPTHLETLQTAEQQARIAWLKTHCQCSTDILDIGCNLGYVLNELNGKCGIDINPANIDKAMREFPHIYFMVGDVTKGLHFFDNHCAIVIMADVLEHIKWSKVGYCLKDALRVAKRKLLITLPYKEHPKFACCFKHKWIPRPDRIGDIVGILLPLSHSILVEQDSNFIYLEIRK